MDRRSFIATTALVLGGLSAFRVRAEAGKAVADKDLLKDGMPAAVPNYCQHPEKQPNKYCPTPKGHCAECQFYNADKSETTFKGVKVAHCQLLADPSKPQYVYSTSTCSTFVKKA